MVNIFRRVGKIASRAGKALTPKGWHGPRHGSRHYLRKHVLNGALVGGGVALGAGSDLVIDAIKGGDEEPPFI